MLLFGYRYGAYHLRTCLKKGREIGNRVGQTIEVDKQSWQDNQARFMRIKVDLPIDKPLRRGGHIANAEGKRS